MPTPQQRNYGAKNVSAYIKASGVESRPLLNELRATIKSTIPKVEESISWGIPYYKSHGLLFGFAAFKTYASFGFCAMISPEVREVLEKKGYKTGKKTVQIKFGQKVPTTVLKQILKAQAKKNEARKTSK